MSRRRALGLLLSVVVAGAVGMVVWRARTLPDGVGGPDSNGGIPLYYPQDGKSADLLADIKRMWQTEPLTGNAGPNAGPNPRASTDAAIRAASRVFNTVDPVGKTREQIVTLLGDPKTSNDSIYNFPFWPPQPGAMVYRFDTGAYGWQFNVLFGPDGRVREVERHWIH